MKKENKMSYSKYYQKQLERKKLEREQALDRIADKHTKEIERKNTKSPEWKAERITPKFESMKELEAFKTQSWDKFSETPLGKDLLKKSGGVEAVKANMKGGVRKFLTRYANDCEKLKDYRPAEVGNAVHKLGELYCLEKHPKAILDGRKYAEQSVFYEKTEGQKRRCEIDSVVVNKDGSVIISDYKRVNLSNFERTSDGQKWSKWAKEVIGSDYKEKIRNGSDPLFLQERKAFPPKEIKEGFDRYMDQVKEMHSDQLNRYKMVFSAGSGIRPEAISTTIVPYYVFGI